MKNPVVSLIAAMGRILSTIERTSIATIKVLTAHLYRVEVTNPVKKVDVKGTVTVGNQRKLEEQVRKLIEAVRKLPQKYPETKIPAYPAFPKSFRVENPIDTVSVKDLNKIVKELNELNRIVAKLPTKFPEPTKIPPYPKFPEFPQFPKFPDFPKKLEISNPQEKVEVTNLKEILDGLLNQKPDVYINARLTNGEDFYEAIRSAISTIKRDRLPFKTSAGIPQEALIDDQRRLVVSLGEYGINNESTSGNTTYTGNEDPEGKWYLMKVTTATGGTTIRYASVINNDAVSDYTTAWDNKESLEYGLYSEAF